MRKVPTALFVLGMLLVIDFASVGSSIATGQDQCMGDSVVWRDLAPNEAEVTNDASVPCPVIYGIYNTFGKRDLREGDQYLIVPAKTATVDAKSTKKLTVANYDSTCFVQIDVVVGWPGGVLNPLTYSRQYGTEYLARYYKAGEGPALTRGSRVCPEHVKPPGETTPSPVPTNTSTPTTVPTQTATSVPTSTATAVPTYSPTSQPSASPTQAATSTPTPTQSTVVTTPTTQPTNVPTPTATATTPAKTQPTASPPSKGPGAPSTGSGGFDYDPTKDIMITGILLAVAGLCLFGSYFSWSTGKRNRY